MIYLHKEGIIMANSNKFLDLDTLAYFKGKNDGTYVAQVSGKGLSTNDFTDAYKNKVDAADEKASAAVEGSTGAYTIKKATSSAVGGVKVGDTISDTTDYTKVKIDANGAIYYANAPGMEAATGSALGAVKVDSTQYVPAQDDGWSKVKIDANGFIYYHDGDYTLPAAATNALGGVKVGEVISTTTGYTGIKIDSNGLAYYHDTTYSAASSSADGLMSSTDYAKLAAFSAASDYALKSDIVGVYIYKGSVDHADALPLSGNTKGDVYNVTYRYTLTDSQPSDWSSNYTSYYTKSGSDYTAVTGSSAPAWAANTYYQRYDDGTNYAWKSASATGTAADWDPLGGSFEIDKITTADIDALFA